MNPQKTSQAGYSLAEMLTVIAIIGTLALVSVPAFLTFRNSNKMKSSMRNLTNDLRATRQLSISRGQQTMLSFGTGAKARSYNTYLGNAPFGSTTWRLRTNLAASGIRGTRNLDDIVYFPADSGSTPQSFTDVADCSAVTTCAAGTDSKLDVVFFPDGHVLLPTGATSATITLKTDSKIPKNQYTITISPSGRVQAQ
jgi:prepilin-type N-terminal cleavage/methylation domain-containing protein